MSFLFDEPVSRSGTDSTKWNKYGGKDILPLWVADMDFTSPPQVIRALEERSAHGVFGYGDPPVELAEVVCAWLDDDFSWKVDPDWLVWLPGLVSGLSVTCRSVGKSGDGVAVMTPVYPPFLKVPDLMDRRLQTIALTGDNNLGWGVDPRRMTTGLDPETRLLLLCHPHNPVGRMWDEAELTSIAEVCLEKRVVICSDEIHNQLILEPGRSHVPMAALGPEVAARTITLLAPSKAYNIAGLGCSVAVIPDPGLRRRFKQAAAGIVPGVNVMGYVAALAAWRDGGAWLEELLAYLRVNRDFLAGQVAGMSGLNMSRVEATYLAWLDCQDLGLEDPVAHFEGFGLGLSDGRDFGGPGFLRLNFGCSRSLLEEACRRLERAVAST